MKRLALRDKVTIQNPTATSADSLRTPSGSGYEDVETVRAEVDVDPPKEQIRAGRHEAEQTATVTMRHRDAVGNETRLLWASNGDLEMNVVGTPRTTDRQGRWMEVDVHIDRQS